MAVAIVFVGIIFAGFLFAMFSFFTSTATSPTKASKKLRTDHKNLLSAFTDLSEENSHLKAENTALRLGLPYPTVHQFNTAQPEEREKIKEISAIVESNFPELFTKETHGSQE